MNKNSGQGAPKSGGSFLKWIIIVFAGIFLLNMAMSKNGPQKIDAPALFEILNDPAIGNRVTRITVGYMKDLSLTRVIVEQKGQPGVFGFIPNEKIADLEKLAAEHKIPFDTAVDVEEATVLDYIMRFLPLIFYGFLIFMIFKKMQGMRSGMSGTSFFQRPNQGVGAEQASTKFTHIS